LETVCCFNSSNRSHSDRQPRGAAAAVPRSPRGWQATDRHLPLIAPSCSRAAWKLQLLCRQRSTNISRKGQS